LRQSVEGIINSYQAEFDEENRFLNTGGGDWGSRSFETNFVPIPAASRSCGSASARVRRVVRWLPGLIPGPLLLGTSWPRPAIAARQRSADQTSAPVVGGPIWELQEW